MKISFSAPALPKTVVLILLLRESEPLSGLAAAADTRTAGHIARAMKAGAFTGRRDSSLDLVAPGDGFSRIVLYGIGLAKTLKPLDVEMLGGAIAGVLQGLKVETASLAADVEIPDIAPHAAAALLGSGAMLRVYSFNHYKSKKPENKALKDNVQRLEDRLKVLERIATDPSRRLSDDIDNLR